MFCSNGLLAVSMVNPHVAALTGMLRTYAYSILILQERKKQFLELHTTETQQDGVHFNGLSS